MALMVENVCKSFGAKLVVDNICFSCDTPGVFGLIGTNGAGKTTTIRMILGIMPKDSGKILWDGKSVTRDNVSFGYMPEERGIYIKNKVREQLLYFARLNGMHAADAEKSVDTWLDRLGLSEYADMRAEKLSKGNQQKVQLIACLVHDPELIFLDEPFSGLDPINTDIFRDVIRDLVAAGKYIIMSSHQMATVEEYCENLLILNKGKTVLSGNLRKIKAGYGHTNLVVSADSDVSELAAAQGLSLIEKRADCLEFAIQGDDPANAFLKAMIEQGIFPTRFEVREPSLHEIFIEKVGEAI